MTVRGRKAQLTAAWRMVTMILAAAVVAILLPVPPATAQTGSAPAQAVVAPGPRLDADKAVVDRVEATLARADLSDASLQLLRSEIDPVAADLGTLVTELSPRLDAAKARLDQLGPKPTDKTEAPDITKERDAQTKLFNDLDATTKRAKVLAVQVGQLSDAIVARRRALFARSVLERSTSLLLPSLWVGVAEDVPSNLRAVRYLATDWWTGTASKLPPWEAAIVVALLVLVVGLFVPLMRLSRRFVRRRADSKPGRLRKALVALWITFVTIVVPSASMAAIIGILDGADLITSRLAPMAHSLLIGVVVVSTMVGLSRGLLAPGRPSWRLIGVSDQSARKLYSLTATITAIVALSEFVTVLNEAIAVALPTAVATRGLTALAIAAVMGRALHLIDNIVASMDGKQALPARGWAGPARIFGWLLVAVLIGTVAVGYVALGAFLVRQIVYLTGLGALLFLLLTLTDEGILNLAQPRNRFGRSFLITSGLQRESLEQFAILLSGAVRIALFIVAGLLAVAPWKIDSGDTLSTLQAAFFGFKIGSASISISTIVVALALFLLAIAITRAVQRWLDTKYLPHTHLDVGLRNSIRTSFGYLGFLVAMAIAAGYVGVSFDKVTYLASALSVGIGFGLQSVVSNFVSGLIILWERAIRVGDWIVVGSEEGYVRRINVRSTEIETFDRATVVVPNSNLMTGVVKNWVRNDRIGRIRMPLTVGLAAKPDELRDLLIKIAKAHDHVLSIPSPTVLFTSYADDKMTFELICFVEDVEAAKRTQSDLLFTIHAKLVEAGIIATPAPAILQSPVLEHALATIAADKAGPVALREAANSGA